MITVMGATGNTGAETVRLLLNAGEKVQALGRSADRLAPLAEAGATPLVGEAADAAFLTGAFHGSESVYTLLPYDPRSADYHAEQERVSESIVRAVRDARVPHVVALSSVGADMPAGTGFIASLHDHEQRLGTLPDSAVLVLRPGSFFENFAAVPDVVAAYGVNADAVAPDAAIPMIATKDIAEVAAAALRSRDWSGVVVRELLGPRDLTYPEATAILGARLGRPDLGYVRLPDADMIGALQQAGFSAGAAALHVELGRALSDGTIASRQGRTALTTTPTRFEDFVEEVPWTA